MRTADGDDRGPLVAGVDMIVAGLARVQSASADELTHPELLAQLDRLKSVTWALPAVEQRLLARLACESDPKALGGTSLANVLATRMRISPREARRGHRGPRPEAGIDRRAVGAPPDHYCCRTGRWGHRPRTRSDHPQVLRRIAGLG
jgi:hypothetical protein